MMLDFLADVLALLVFDAWRTLLGLICGFALGLAAGGVSGAISGALVCGAVGLVWDISAAKGDDNRL